jgi:hypothetical protein
MPHHFATSPVELRNYFSGLFKELVRQKESTLRFP